MGNKCITESYEFSEKQKKYFRIKRMTDIVLSGMAIICLSPLLAVISAAIKIESPGPVLFKQKRVGKDKKFFEIWKFRSMRTDTPKDIPTHMLSNPDQYITKIGKFLRKRSLDGKVIIRQTLKNLDFARISPVLSNW